MKQEEVTAIFKRVLQCHNRKPCVITEQPCRECPYQTTTDEVDMAIAAAVAMLEGGETDATG